ncbi:MAG: pentapeptide repeat-containing protein [Planktothrix sp.]
MNEPIPNQNDPIPNRTDIELNTEKAGGVAGKVDGDLIVAETYIQVNNPAPTENAALTLDIDPSKYTPAELAELIETIMKSVSIIGDGTLKLAYYKKGSIKLVLNGSPEDIAELQRLINSKELTQIEGHNISEVQETTREEDAKISLIQQIKTGEFHLRRNAVMWANLSEADLSEADLSEVNLDGSDLSEANLGGSDLGWASPGFIANLRWGSLRWERHSGPTVGPLNEADLGAVNLRGANLRGANLRGTNLRMADLRTADLRGADLRGADLYGADLYGADLSGANLHGADLSGADLSGADLRGANLETAYLIKATLENTNLKNATVLKAIFGNNEGIDEALKAALIEKGAIFQDAPGDRSSVLTPV